MARIVEGVALIAGAVLLTIATAGAASVLAPLAFQALLYSAEAIGIAGIGVTLGGIAKALEAGPSLPFSVKQPAAARQCVYGQTRIAGIIIYESTTNNGHDLNQVIVWAGHQLQSIDTVYLDGRATHLNGSGTDNGQTYQDDSGNNYSFGSGVNIVHSLGTVPGAYFSSLGTRDTNWDSSCTLDGLAASYCRFTYNTNLFQGPPGVKANVHGKQNIYDPRSQTYSYSNNAALVICDFLCNSEFGLGCNYATEINEPQLIAAANLCDQSIALASGATEARYTINGAFTTDSTPGDLLDALLACCEGRISYSGGQFLIYPAAFWGSGLAFTQADMVGPVKWSPKRKYRDLVNAVRATYISPRYPYAIVGYDQDHKDPNIWSGQWQPTDIPEYAQDALHGYPSDANLSADGGVKLYASRSYRFCTSVSMAQRLAKIFLLRNRFQGTGTLRMSLSAYQCIAQDVIQVSMPALGWAGKYLEVQTIRFMPKVDQDGQESGQLYVELDVNETDPSIYLWSAAEERGVLNTTSPAIYNSQQVNPPTSLTLESGADSAVVGADGVTLPRININWIEPDDPFVLSGGVVELQYQKLGGPWLTIGYFNPSITQYYLSGVVAGQSYNVQIRAQRSNGATSGWISAGPHTVSTQLSVISVYNVSGIGALATRNYVDFSSGTIAGAGSLATANYVDMATGQVVNKSASYLQYSTGLSLEALRPATALADKTAGQSIDILADGQVYVRTKASESVGGVIVGRSYGYNVLPNNGFELATNGITIADDWFVEQNSTPSYFAPYLATGGGHSGNNALVIRVQPYTILQPNNYLGCRVFSTRIPVQGGQLLFYGGYWRWASSIGIPAGAQLQGRISIFFFDSKQANLAEAAGSQSIGDIINRQNGNWNAVSGFTNAPSNAAYLNFECAIFGLSTASGNTQIGNGLVMDFAFDDLFLVFTTTSSALLNPQGSIQPNQSVLLTYTCTKSSVSITFPAQSIYRSDGTTLSVPAGGLTWNNLAASTTYYFYPYVLITNQSINFVGGLSTPLTSPNTFYAAQTALDGCIPIPVMKITTLASTNGGSGSGTGGGGDTCPEADELVEIEGKGQIRAGDVGPGDWIKGYSFRTQRDSYRRVLQVQSVTAAAWRMLEGHRVSPCEPVYHEGQWQPAFRARGAAHDAFEGHKVRISVEADEYDEMNYWLVSGGEPLLIHNTQILPC